MIRDKKYVPVVMAALCGMVWMACTQERLPCYTPKVASFNIETVHLLTDTSTIPVDTALPAARFGAILADSVRGVQYPQQSLFTISLSPVANTCKWLFTTDSLNTSVYDTLTFFYQRDLQFLSNACGYTYFYNLDSVHTTHINIDSFHILNTSVTNNVNTEHLKIYIHPDY